MRRPEAVDLVGREPGYRYLRARGNSIEGGRRKSCATPFPSGSSACRVNIVSTKTSPGRTCPDERAHRRPAVLRHRRGVAGRRPSAVRRAVSARIGDARSTTRNHKTFRACGARWPPNWAWPACWFRSHWAAPARASARPPWSWRRSAGPLRRCRSCPARSSPRSRCCVPVTPRPCRRWPRAS